MQTVADEISHTNDNTCVWEVWEGCVCVVGKAEVGRQGDKHQATYPQGKGITHTYTHTQHCVPNLDVMLLRACDRSVLEAWMDVRSARVAPRWPFNIH